MLHEIVARVANDHKMDSDRDDAKRPAKDSGSPSDCRNMISNLRTFFASVLRAFAPSWFDFLVPAHQEKICANIKKPLT
jgi:hypothetical protein